MTKRLNITATVGFTVPKDKDPEQFLEEKLKTFRTNLIFDNINILWEKKVKDLAWNRTDLINKTS